VTGHEDPAKPDSLLDWPALARFPGTLVFYMGLSRLETLTRTLIDNGMDPSTPAAVVQWATLPRQRTVEATLGTLAEAVRVAGLTAPALVIVGNVVSLRSQVAWLEDRPLFGKRVLVTRPAGQDEAMLTNLEALGAEVFSQPTVVIGEPDDWRPADDAIAQLGEFHWLVFTSANGVTWFMRRMMQKARDLRALGGMNLAAIGPATANALRGFHLEPDLVPESYRSEALAAALVPAAAGKNVLLARADRGRDVLREQLEKAARVEQVAVYSQKDVPAAEPSIKEMLAKSRIDFVTLTSSNIARSLRRMLGDDANAALASGRTRIVTISPLTSATVRELGWPVAAEAAEYTADGVLAALVSLG
jgi:uroporphyrinogen III methyltransferase/synthase